MPFDNPKNDHTSVIKGSRHRRLLSEAIQLEEEVVPQYVKSALFAVTALVVGVVVWSGFVEINEVAIAPGEIIPSGSVKVIEHLRGGSVKQIEVDEGAHVEKGQIVLILDETQANSELKQIEARYNALRLRGERLAAFADGREPDFSFVGDGYPQLVADQQTIYRNQIEGRSSSKSVVSSQIDQRKRELRQMTDSLSVAHQQQTVTSEMVVMRKKMLDKKLIPKMQYLETNRAKIAADGEVSRITDQIQLTRQTVIESQRRLRDLDVQLRRESLAEMGTVSAEIAEVANNLDRNRDRVQRLKIRSPIAGIVQDLKVQTVGQVVQPGGLVMRIVPEDVILEAEVRIQTADIGHVNVGQDVSVKVSSYNFSRFGGVDGKLRRISATSHVKDNGDAYFKGWVSLNKPYVGDDPRRFQITSGMGVQADIQTGNKTLLEYLVKPLADVANRAFRER